MCVYKYIIATIITMSVLACVASGAEKLSSADIKHFETHVRPVLAGQCLKCHGEKKQKGELRLDSRAAMLKGGESGPAIEPGSPDESLLIEAIRHESFEMPPDTMLPDATIAAVAKWIERGAPWPQHNGADVVLREAGRTITEKDRQWWAYQPVKRPAVPTVPGDTWSRNPVDRFIYRRLHSAGITPSPEADRRTLIRRATFDLIGLPPTPEEVEAFVNDKSAGAYEKLIDRLLASPRYGEHWASYWLDLVRYAESDGYRKDDYRSEASKYRDYVIRSLNNDKPYDRFVREQLAGDELYAGDRDALIATMYLKHGIYEYNQRDCETQRLDMLNDITDVTGDVFLASGMGCARCHDHKFDALLQKDYFRLQAFFAPLAFDNRATLATVDQRREHQKQLAIWDAKTEGIRRALWAIEQPTLARKAGGQGFAKFAPEIKTLILKWPADRTPHEQQIVELAERQLDYNWDDLEDQLKDEQNQRRKELRTQLAEFAKLKPPSLPRVNFVARDVGRVAPASYIPGETEQAIAPGFLSVIDESPVEIPVLPEHFPTTGRRSVLANWIASEDNPLSTRVITNRIWQYHFGRGIVASSSDFGHLGDKPTHPDLLDWLTSEFLERGWRIKPMHKLIMTSATYRQASVVATTERARHVDPQNELLWRGSIQRPHAEVIRDSILAVSGELNHGRGDKNRRSIYLKVRRNSPDPVLSAFDFPDRISSMEQRSVTTTPIQSLLVVNSDWMIARANAFAARLTREKHSSADQLIRRAYALAYNRQPTNQQMKAATAFL
ncbi:MAG: PSD1 and planctomycete cytochrome C domain-containing protein, partial [Pirellulales bacterium]|nr:PSD1 and planctomycete cytochrome C domain-containing protein [Pirellulales bacterium]